MRNEDLDVVRALTLFRTMDESTFQGLMQAAYLQTFPPQVQLIDEGDPADFLHVMVEGCAELTATANNRETTMALVRPVSTFILAAVIKDAVYLMSARTLERSRILLIPSRNIREAFAQDASFARAIVEELATCYRGVVKALKDQKLRSAVERLANYLLRLHRQQGASGSLTLPYDKRTIASLLGMTPENLSRAFSTLRPYGVEVDGARIALSKLEDLNGLAKPSPLIDASDG